MSKNPDQKNTLPQYNSNEVIKNTQKEIKAHKKYVINNVDLPSQGLEKLEKLYDNPDFPKDIILNLIKEKLSKASFNEQIGFIKRNKEKPNDLFYYGLVEILKHLKGQNEAQEFLKVAGEDNIKKAIADYIKIDKDFVNKYVEVYTDDTIKITQCDGFDKDVCKKTYAFVKALVPESGIGDINAVFSVIAKAWGKDLKNFTDVIDNSLQTYYNVDKGLDGEYKLVFKKRGLVGLIKRFNEDLTSGVGGNEVFKNGVVIIEAIAGLAIVWKIISSAFKKLGWKSILGILFGGTLVMNTKYGDSIIDIFDKLLYGGFELDNSTKEGVEKAKENKEIKNQLGCLVFVNTILGDKKPSEIKEYLKFKDGKLVGFDVEKLLKDMSDDWTKELIKKLGIKTAEKAFVSGLKQLGLSNETDFDNNQTTISKLYKGYLKKINSQQGQQNTLTSQSSSNVSVVAPAVGVGNYSINNISQKSKSINSGGSVNGSSSSVKNSLNNVSNNIDNSPDKSIFTRTLMYYKDGHYYMLGKDGTPETITMLSLAPEYKEKLEKIKEINEKVDLLLFLMGAVEKKYPETKEGIEKAQKQLSLLLKDFLKGNIKPEDFDKNFDKILKTAFVYKIERGRSRGTNYDIYKDIKKLFNKETLEDLKVAVYKYVDDELDCYDLVANRIVQENFYQTKVKPETLKALYDAITKSQYSSVKDIVNKDKKLVSIIETNGKTVDDFIKDLNDIRKKLDEAKSNINLAEEAKKAGFVDKKGNPLTEQYEEALNKLIVLNGIKYLILSYFVKPKVDIRGDIEDKYKNTVDNYKELNIFSDIEGFGMLNMPERDKDIAGLILETALIELAAMGVGVLTGGLGAAALEALAVARWTKRGAEIISDVSKLSRWERLLNTLELGGQIYRVSKKGKIAYLVGSTVVEGTLFYEGTNLVQNIFEKRNLFDGAGDLKEIAKSILFVGALKGLSKLTEKIPGLKIKEGDSLSKKVVKLTSQITIEGLTIGGISGGINVAFGEGTWTAEDFVEGIIMAMMFKLMGGAAKKLLVKKTAGKIELSSVSAKPDLKNVKIFPQHEFYINPKTGTKYTKTADGKWINSKRKELKRAPKNVVKLNKTTLDHLLKVNEQKLLKVNKQIKETTEKIDKEIEEKTKELKKIEEKLKNTPKKSPILNQEGSNYISPAYEKLANNKEEIKRKIEKLKDQKTKELEKLHKEQKKLEKMLKQLEDTNNYLQKSYSKNSSKNLDDNKISKNPDKGVVNKKDIKKIVEEIKNSPIKTKDKDGFETEIGYDKDSKKFYVKKTGVIEEPGDIMTTSGGNMNAKKTLVIKELSEEELKKYLLKNKELLESLEKDILLKKAQELITQQTKKWYKEKIPGTDLFKGPQFKLNNKDFVVVKDKDGKFYVVEKEKSKWLVDNKQLLDDFLSGHPEIAETFYKSLNSSIKKIFSGLENQKIGGLPKNLQEKIASILGKTPDKLKNIVLGDLINLPDIKNQPGVLKKITGLIKWILTGKVDASGKDIFWKGFIKGNLVLWVTYSVEEMLNYLLSYFLPNEESTSSSILDWIVDGFARLTAGYVNLVKNGDYQILIDWLLLRGRLTGGVLITLKDKFFDN